MNELNDTSKDLKKVRRYGKKMAQKMAFSNFVKQKAIEDRNSWECCAEKYSALPALHVHISAAHKETINALADQVLSSSQQEKSTKQTPSNATGLPHIFSEEDEYTWLPRRQDIIEVQRYKVILFYHYRVLEDAEHVKIWQTILCQRLHLTGKVRIAKEGLNGTLCGHETYLAAYIEAVKSHPFFCKMTGQDFKHSECEGNAFEDGLKVGVYQEAVPMGIDPDEISFKNTGFHLPPEEFHEAVEKYLKDPDEMKNTVLVDCRNFYESKIGKFNGAICPDLRKFSYWPEYVEKNMELFKQKKVLMYCTGGIRCERGSAYLKEKGITDSVYQLQGGIHKYMEKFPEGHFRGKLFVFDDRFSIQSNKDIISECVYCSQPWDTYRKCCSGHCHQLVLSCDDCCQKGHTACCTQCKNSTQTMEQCLCTQSRQRVSYDVNTVPNAELDK